MSVIAHSESASGAEPERVRHKAPTGVVESLHMALRADSPFVRLSRAVAITGGGVVAGLGFHTLGGILGGIIGAALFILSEKDYK